MQLGTQELTLSSTGPIPNFVPEARILDIPFLFRDKAQAQAVLDGPIGQAMLTKFDSKGFKALAWAENGVRHRTNGKRAVNAPEDLERLKMRTMENPVQMAATSAEFGVNAALFVIGMFVETSAAIIVLAPILAPVAVHFGIDPVHFGLIMLVNLAMGMITPPFGLDLFAACTVARIALDRMIAFLPPFVLVIIGCLMVATYIPGLSLGLRDPVYAK